MITDTNELKEGYRFKLQCELIRRIGYGEAIHGRPNRSRSGNLWWANPIGSPEIKICVCTDSIDTDPVITSNDINHNE